MLTKIYKPGQGKYTRLWTGFVVGLIAALGCWRLYDLLAARVENLVVVMVVPVVVFVGLGVLIYWLLNKASVADFMIAAEGELKKVSWSSRQEIMASTIIVIVVVIAMAVLLGTTDLLFTLVFKALLRPGAPGL
ncbi:MAG: preprotein translocase subunit SecE [Sedimentisphaerales bacterium]|nr:preprotein translocase subunit SecE [Sedimentisphaerales bacterium]